MYRFSLRMAAIAAGMIALSTGSAFAQDKPTINSIFVTKNIFMLTGVGGFTGGNVGVSTGPDGLLIIDNKLPDFSIALDAELKKLKSGDVKYVLNTHWHFDHVGGNPYFGDKATIVAHKNVLARVNSDQVLTAFKREIPAYPKVAWPNVTYENGVSLHFNGEEIKVTHMPAGHTDGDSVIYFTGANVLHLGDHFFNGFFPFVDLEHGGNVVGLTKNIAKIMKSYPQDVRIIPGHGPLAKMTDLKVYHDMLVETTAVVKGHKDKGMSLDDAKKAGLPAKFDGWAKGFINVPTWITFVYNSL